MASRSPAGAGGRLSMIGRRLGGFSASIVIMAVANLASVPLVITTAGAQAWSGIVVAQAIASFTAVILAFGWGVTGPTEVGQLPLDRRGEYFRRSLSGRLALALVLIPSMSVAVLELAPGNSTADVLAALALALPAVGASWFFTGERAPMRLLCFETVPRAGGIVVGVGLLALGGGIVWFAAAQAAGALVAVLVSARDVTRRYRGEMEWHPRRVVQNLVQQRHGLVVAVSNALTLNFPVFFAGLVLGAAVPVYAIADKLQKLTLTAISPALQVAQGTVSGPDEQGTFRRAWAAVRIGAVIAVALAVGFAVLGHWASGILANSRITMPFTLAIPMGVWLGATFQSWIAGVACLPAVGATRYLARSAISGTFIGLPLVIVGALGFGAIGIASAAAATQLAVGLYQMKILRSFTRAARLPGGAEGATAPRSGLVRS